MIIKLLLIRLLSAWSLSIACLTIISTSPPHHQTPTSVFKLPWTALTNLADYRHEIFPPQLEQPKPLATLATVVPLGVREITPYLLGKIGYTLREHLGGDCPIIAHSMSLFSTCSCRPPAYQSGCSRVGIPFNRRLLLKATPEVHSSKFHNSIQLSFNSLHSLKIQRENKIIYLSKSRLLTHKLVI